MNFSRDLIFPLYILRHPFEGYDALKVKRAWSYKLSIFLVALWFIAMICMRQLSSFRFNGYNLNELNVLYIFAGSAGLLIAFCISNWSICTLFDGEGTFKEIFSACSYALTPYIASVVLYTALSHVFSMEEGVFMAWMLRIGQLWTVFLIFAALITVQRYSFLKTLVSTFVALIGVVFIVFLIFLLMTLFQQVLDFFESVYSEIMLRLYR